MSQTLVSASAFSLSVTASGNGTLSYQWFKNGSPISGATSASYALASLVAGDAGGYSVVVTNTIPLSTQAQVCQKIRQLSVAPLIAETMQRIAKGESVMSLFSDQNQLF